MTDYETHERARIAHWNTVARQLDSWKGWGGEYHRRLVEVYRTIVPPGQRVLELGCARGDLLAALHPGKGLGIDFSPFMLERARQRHPDLQFILADVHELSTLDSQFDFILISDLLNDVWDVQTVLEQIRQLLHPRTRIIINSYNRMWELPLAVAEKLGLAKPTLRQNWLAPQDITNILGLTRFELIRHWTEILFPLRIPLISGFLNRILVRFWPFNHLALTSFFIARLQPPYDQPAENQKVSVIIPACNEAGNIPTIFENMPELGSGTEMVFVEGHSNDDTFHVIEQQITEHPKRQCQLHRQAGIGKGDAARMGMACASGNIIIIYDADMTVPFEYLPRFYDALCSGQGEFINGVRLVYPMEDDAMRFLNLVGNKFFSLVFSWLLGQSIKDTLCGTKALAKVDYNLIADNRTFFGDFDPYGDYDLIFGAARLGLKIVDLPVRYQARSYGTTNIHRWRHGWLLLRMVGFAARRIKFV
jgi:ubiquinone/menaquinone biosynthesis C-methylase UbiE